MASSPTPDASDSNPFDDPAASQHLPETEAVLTVGRNATLTLGTDALIVLDEGLERTGTAEACFRLLWSRSKTTHAIPFHNVLWAELTGFDITVHYAHPSGSKGRGCVARYIHYTLTDQKLEQAQRWVDSLMERAYSPSTQRRKRIKVLVNPFGGQGNAQKLWTREIEPILAAARCEIDVERTAYRGHAVEIAQQLDIDAYDVVACASGDGLPYEVFNGLAKHKHARRALRQIAVCQLPCGTGNAMSLNLNGTDSPSLAALEIIKGMRSPLDLVAITQGTKQYYSFLSQAVGIVAESDLGTEALRWMGPLRFSWGLLVRIVGQTQYPATVSFALESEDKAAIREAHRRAYDAHCARAPSHPADRALLDDAADRDADPGRLPPLRFGTVADALPPSFATHDMPALGNFYAGNMCYMTPDAPFFPAALPADGKIDLVTIQSDIPRTTALSMLLQVAEGKLMDYADVAYRKVWAYRVVPRYDSGDDAGPPAAEGDDDTTAAAGAALRRSESYRQRRRRLRANMARWLSGAGDQTEGYIAIDGERVPFEPFQAELVPGLGTVLSKRGAVYEFDGPK